MHYYLGFGLSIQTPLTFPELPPRDDLAGRPCDVEISPGTVSRHPDTADESGRGLWVRAGRACYSVNGVGTFEVCSGRQVTVEPAGEVADEALRLCVLGPVLGLILIQRGFFPLHASAVAIGDVAVGFLGGHGWGKSTMAALMQARGYPVITDDLLALEPDTDRVVPSFPQLKLWPDAVDALGHVSDELPLIHPDVTKRALRFGESFSDESLPLRRLYVLAVGESTSIQEITAKQAFGQVMQHWYGSRFGPALLESVDKRAHFLRVSRLVQTVPIRGLLRPGTLNEDPALGDEIEGAILEDLGTDPLSEH